VLVKKLTDIAGERVVDEVVEISEDDHQESYKKSHCKYIFGSVHGEFFRVWVLGQYYTKKPEITKRILDFYEHSLQLLELLDLAVELYFIFSNQLV
jgi:hypothetical protein